jgi:hypothetical protein
LSRFYDAEPGSRTLLWKPILYEVSFTLNGCGVTGSVYYFLYIQAVIEEREFSDDVLDNRAFTRLEEALVSAGLITVIDGIGRLRSELPAGKVRLPIIDPLAPKPQEERSGEDVARAQRLRVEAAIILVMKRMKKASGDEAFSEATKAVNFGIARRDFDAGVKSFLEKSWLVKDEQGQLQYVFD